MLKISDNHFASFYWNKEEGYTEHSWKEGTKLMTTEEYKSEMHNFIEQNEKIKTKKILVDTRLFNFPIGAKLQKWVADEIHPKQLSWNLDKFAFVIPKDFFAKMAVEQTIEEFKYKNATLFKDYNHAKDFLKN